MGRVARRRRTEALRGTFGEEYDRTVAATDSTREAESELEARRRRRETLDIRPVAPGARARYAEEWRAVQARFVDDPAGALSSADGLVTRVMSERGYPMEDFDQRAADISVDHPRTVNDYREAYGVTSRLAEDAGDAGDAGTVGTVGTVGTEDMRRAMLHYHSLFDELLEGDEGAGHVSDAG